MISVVAVATIVTILIFFLFKKNQKNKELEVESLPSSSVPASRNSIEIPLQEPPTGEVNLPTFPSGKINLSQFVFKDIVGKGNFGVVWRQVSCFQTLIDSCEFNGNIYAAKQLNTEGFTADGVEEMRKEANIMR